MSFNIFMVPVALALRVVMGEEGFNNWVRSREVRMNTVIKKESELERIVGMAGYDFIAYSTFRKTHFSNTFFLWEKEGDNWSAVFSTYDKEEDVRLVTERLNRVAGKNIFGSSMNIRRQEKEENNIFPTNFTDKIVLKKALSEADIPFYEEAGKLICVMNGCRMELFQGDKSYYEAQIKINKNFNKSMIYLNVLDEEYKKIVQTETYQNIMKKVKESSDMELEDEYIEEDTLVLVVKCVEDRF